MKITRKCFDEIQVSSEKELCEIIKSIVQGSFFWFGPSICVFFNQCILELIFQEIDIDLISKGNIFLQFHFEMINEDDEDEERFYTKFVLINGTTQHSLDIPP